MLVAGVDVQNDHMVWVVRAVGADLETWGVDYGKVFAWDDLTEVMFRRRWTAHGQPPPVARVCIDVADGNRAGLDIKPEEAWTWIGINAARALGLDKEIGSLAPGKRADVVVWSGSPMSIYSLPEQVLIAGEVAYQRGQGASPASYRGDLSVPDLQEMLGRLEKPIAHSVFEHVHHVLEQRRFKLLVSEVRTDVVLHLWGLTQS